MNRRKECIAMLLAGGQGSRLFVLTSDVAKPAVPFGGKYRIIDFPLSNCVNSGIDTVGVLTQYRPMELNSYVGNGQPWDLDRLNGGVFILPPYVAGKSGTWYKGTANAIYQNMLFIDHYDPDYVLILSGDHIYKMDYSLMLNQHKKTGAAATIAVLEVPIAEAPRFGIMNTDEQGRVYEFEEKPKKPKSNLASMGIYIFSKEKLKSYLFEDEQDRNSENDFGKNIIPNMLKAGEKMMVYRFEGYWKDVGTIDSLWEANMDMLHTNNMALFDPEWRIYSRNPVVSPHFVGSRAQVHHSIVTEGCEIGGTIENSVLFSSVTVEEGATVSYSILMPGVTVESGAVVEYSIIAEDARICGDAHIGEGPGSVELEKWGVAVVAKGVTVQKGAVVQPKQMVD